MLVLTGQGIVDHGRVAGALRVLRVQQQLDWHSRVDVGDLIIQSILTAMINIDDNFNATSNIGTLLVT